LNAEHGPNKSWLRLSTIDGIHENLSPPLKVGFYSLVERPK